MDRDREAQREEVEAAESAARTPGRRSLIASRYPALAAALGDRAGAASIHDAATAAVEHRGSGAPVDSAVAARVGARLSADFSGVRVHSDPLTQQSTAAMGARAFAYGSDVFLGAGESGGDVGLMAHELTHVAQQGAAGQRAIQRAVQVGDADSPAEREADQVSAEVTGGDGRPAALLVDDGPVGPNQMLKSQFLEELRAEVTAAADAELGPSYTAIGCPPIEQYFGRFSGQPAASSEAMLRRLAPTTRTARAAADMIPAVVARMREGVRQWRDTGEAPPELAAMVPTGAAASGGPAQAQALRAPDGGETLGSLEAELGPGQPLDSATASRMSGALGVDVSSARIHAGAVAARKAADAGALAFAVGANVVMGASAPAAGTLEGDALLAHELAHTVQQTGAAADPAARRQPIVGEDNAAEDDADAVATAAVEQLHGGGRGGLVQRLGGVFKTGLQLQRCSDNKAKQRQQAARTALQHLAGLAEPDFRREVGAMTRQQTEDLLNHVAPADRTTHAALLARIRNERLVASAEGMSGQLYWAGGSGADSSDGFRIGGTTRRPTDTDPVDGVFNEAPETNVNEFARWVRGGPVPTTTSKMNCWEMILFAGYQAGVISPAWIFSLHADAAAGGQAAHDSAAAGGASAGLADSLGETAYQDLLASRLGYSTAAPWSPNTAVPRGNLVFFNGIDHVALSTGNVVGGKQEVMSLWIVPFAGGAFNSATQRTTIEDILAGMGAVGAMGAPGMSASAPVKFGPNPW